MIAGIYLATAGALVQQARLSVTANNIANVNTTAYKEEVSVFQRRVSEALENPELRYRSNLSLTTLGGGIYMDEAWTNHRTQGAPKQTGNPFDLMIKGEGYFRLTNEDETEVRYTRAGNFHLRPDGYVVTEDDKWFLTDSRGNRVFAGESTDIRFEANRSIRINGDLAGLVQVVDFEDKDLASLRKIGDNLFEATNGIEEIDFKGNIMVGYLETSAVNAATEMVEMIKTQRQYDANMRLIRLQDETVDRAINSVGSLPS